MSIRSILIPALLICAISAPIFMSEFKPSQNSNGPQIPDNLSNNSPVSNQWPESNVNRSPNGTTLNTQTAQPNPFIESANPRQSRNLSATTRQNQSGSVFQQAAYLNSPSAQPNYNDSNPSGTAQYSNLRTVPFGLGPNGTPTDPRLGSNSGLPPQTNAGQIFSPPTMNPGFPPTNTIDPRQGSQYADSFGYEQIGSNSVGQPRGPATVSYPSHSTDSFADMTPDYGATQTLIFPGNEFGPDLTAPPMEFLPITDFQEIFRFDISSSWVKQRWKRVSTNPGDVGLHGLRIALVTGTNSWDLHGSLTYYFDAQQRLQRITFRGWTGDAGRLLQLLETRFEFQPQQTHLAGFYTAQHRRKFTGGLLMKDPPVVYAENPIEKLAIVMEINDPSGTFELSEEFRALISGSISE